MKELLKYIFLIMFMIQKSYGFSLNNSVSAAFSTDQVIIDVADNCDNLGISDAELLTIVQDSIDQFWNTVATSKLVLKLGSLKTLSSAFYTEKICTLSGNSCDPNPNLVVSSGITISCNENSADNFTSNSILGLTLPNNIIGNVLQGSLLLLNDRVGNSFASKSRAQMVSIIAHELGHAIGLGHSPVEDSLMYFTIVPIRNRLGYDDIDGVTYLYPKEQPISCGSVAYVPDDRDRTTLFTLFFLLCFLGLAIYRNERPLFRHSASY